MGKPAGFMEYSRMVVPDKQPLERIKDFNEFHLEINEEEQKKQGARCMECSIPFCHSGILIKGAVSGCPVNNLIPEWNDLIYRGKWHDAFMRLDLTNNFPEFTGRVCPAPCEGSCTMGINEPPVTIKQNECTIIDRAFEEGWVTPQIPKIRSGKKVAIIGSGPSGLACAAQLNQAGHYVTVFEREDRPGGLLMYGIPNMKLDKKKVVERRINLMKAEGIEFIVSTEAGRDISMKELKSRFDAIVLCGGAGRARDLQVEGRNLKDVHFAMEFLKANTKSLLDSNLNDGKYISAKGRNVIVIGGGDTGTDCVATSLRHGCKSVVQFEIMPKPPTERTIDNPWPEWPRLLKADYGQEEAAAVQGEDPRIYCIKTEKLVGDVNGNIREIHTVQIEWKKDETGRMMPVELVGSNKIWPAELVLICMGFTGAEDIALSELSIEKDSRTNVKTQNGSCSTNVKGVFTAGDMRRGQSLVVWAINEGRSAAAEVDNYLNQE